jgi:hypothetical protein
MSIAGRAKLPNPDGNVYFRDASASQRACKQSPAEEGVSIADITVSIHDYHLFRFFSQKVELSCR